MKILFSHLAFSIILLLNHPFLLAAPIPPEIKSTVGFIYILNEEGKRVPNGTGFFTGVEISNQKGHYKVYLVTAKHVLQTPDKENWLPFFFLRLNKKDGSSEMVQVPIIPSGNNKTLFVHNDSSVDLAVIPMLPKQEIFDFKFLTDSMLTTKEDFTNLEIREGSEVFFTGLFLPYSGYERIYPIVRFGRVALVTEEKIMWDNQLMDLYLIESGVFGGNSGSPVFFYLGADRKPGSIVLGSPILKIAGVIKGHFNELTPITVAETSRIQITASNIGIAAVIAAYKLYELLFSDELKQKREK